MNNKNSKSKKKTSEYQRINKKICEAVPGME